MDDSGPNRSRGMRRDAALNLERILAAAVRAGLASGRQVPMAAIAAEAGVGVGTLYRRFRDRDALLEALQQRAYRLLIEITDEAAASARDGLDAIAIFLERSFSIRSELVLPLHGAPNPRDPETLRLSRQLPQRVSALVRRGRLDGTVRPDVSASTVIGFGALLAQPLDDSEDWLRLADDQRRVFLRGIAERAT